MKERIILAGPTYRHARIVADLIEWLCKMIRCPYDIRKRGDRVDIEVGQYQLSFVPIIYCLNEMAKDQLEDINERCQEILKAKTVNPNQAKKADDIVIPDCF